MGDDLMENLEDKYIELLLKRCLNFDKSKSLFISYDVINKKIKFSATRLYKEHILRLTKEKEVNLCEDDEYDLYGIDINTPISGTYSIEYLGNNMFSNLEFTPNKLVKDDILTCEE